MTTGSRGTISIHALLAESDGRRPGGPFRLMLFLSTLSLRRATCSFCPADSQGRHFYPRSPCGERPFRSPRIALMVDFYPRSPCGERHQQKCRDRKTHVNFYPRSPCGERPPVRDIIQWEGIFLSTLSLRRATREHHNHLTLRVISIHALLAESDDNLTQGVFNLFTFLSTLSLRRATDFPAG